MFNDGFSLHEVDGTAGLKGGYAAPNRMYFLMFYTNFLEKVNFYLSLVMMWCSLVPLNWSFRMYEYL